MLAGSFKILAGNGIDVARQFIKGAQAAAETARLLGIRKAVLKQRSPSRGCGQICRDGQAVDGDGVVAAALKREGIEIFSL